MDRYIQDIVRRFGKWRDNRSGNISGNRTGNIFGGGSGRASRK